MEGKLDLIMEPYTLYVHGWYLVLTLFHERMKEFTLYATLVFNRLYITTLAFFLHFFQTKP